MPFMCKRIDEASPKMSILFRGGGKLALGIRRCSWCKSYHLKKNHLLPDVRMRGNFKQGNKRPKKVKS